MGNTIGIGLLGFGTVGSGVYEHLARNGDLLRERLGIDLRIERIAVRDSRKPRSAPAEPGAMQVRKVCDLERPSERRLDRAVSHFDSVGLNPETVDSDRKPSDRQEDEQELAHFCGRPGGLREASRGNSNRIILCRVIGSAVIFFACDGDDRINIDHRRPSRLFFLKRHFPSSGYFRADPLCEAGDWRRATDRWPRWSSTSFSVPGNLGWISVDARFRKFPRRTMPAVSTLGYVSLSRYAHVGERPGGTLRKEL